MNQWRVKYMSQDITMNRKERGTDRIGTEVYRHPLGYFIVLELQGKGGKFRESFRWDEVFAIYYRKKGE